MLSFLLGKYPGVKWRIHMAGIFLTFCEIVQVSNWLYNFELQKAVYLIFVSLLMFYSFSLLNFILSRGYVVVSYYGFN